MKKYQVMNLDTNKEVEITAKSPMEAVKKVFGTDKVKRTYDDKEKWFFIYYKNEGNILVSYNENGIYRSYTYILG